MLQAYRDGKDLYATMGVGVYHNDYWDNMEHHEDGSPNPDGAKRRKNMKTLLLGIMYGMGAASIAEDLNISTQEANNILNNFYEGFPKVKQWQDYTRKFAKDNGYVEDFWGRRRRLPDIQLPDYEVIDDSHQTTFNPILGAKGLLASDNTLVKTFEKRLANCKSFQEKAKIKQEAFKSHITIKDNGGFISTAERECVNARVQGGAASMTKIAMRKIFDDEELKSLGFKLVLQIHDEVIGECPEENAEKCSELLSKIMRESVKEWLSVPFKCDASVIHAWYSDEFSYSLKNTFEKLQLEMSKEEALHKIITDHTECTVDQIYEFLGLESVV